MTNACWPPAPQAMKVPSGIPPGSGVPVVVVPERAGLVAAARRPLFRHGCRLVERRVIDARSCLQQHPHRRLLFGVGERGCIVIDAELGQRAVQDNLSLCRRDADQRAEQALAHRRQLRAFDRVSPLRHHGAAMDHHEGGRMDLP